VEILVNGEEQKVNIFIHQLQNENPTASKIKYFKVKNIDFA
jgi:acylphosphatase